jgi:hypothetical protein
MALLLKKSPQVLPRIWARGPREPKEFAQLRRIEGLFVPKYLGSGEGQSSIMRMPLPESSPVRVGGSEVLPEMILGHAAMPPLGAETDRDRRDDAARNEVLRGADGDAQVLSDGGGPKDVMGGVREGLGLLGLLESLHARAPQGN